MQEAGSFIRKRNGASHGPLADMFVPVDAAVQPLLRVVDVKAWSRSRPMGRSNSARVGYTLFGGGRSRRRGVAVSRQTAKRSGRRAVDDGLQVLES
jgi:hypothetical protein